MTTEFTDDRASLLNDPNVIQTDGRTMTVSQRTGPDGRTLTLQSDRFPDAPIKPAYKPKFPADPTGLPCSCEGSSTTLRFHEVYTAVCARCGGVAKG